MTSEDRAAPRTEAHAIFPGGPACQPNCPGDWSEYHDGYADGWERATSVPVDVAALIAAVDDLPLVRFEEDDPPVDAVLREDVFDVLRAALPVSPDVPLRAAAAAVMREWDVLGPTGTQSTLDAHKRLRTALQGTAAGGPSR